MSAVRRRRSVFRYRLSCSRGARRGLAAHGQLVDTVRAAADDVDRPHRAGIVPGVLRRRR